MNLLFVLPPVEVIYNKNKPYSSMYTVVLRPFKSIVVLCALTKIVGMFHGRYYRVTDNGDASQIITDMSQSFQSCSTSKLSFCDGPYDISTWSAMPYGIENMECLNTQLRDDKKPTKELRKSTETDKNQKDIPCKSIIRFPKIAVKGNQLRGNTFKGKRNNTFDNVFEADFENLPHAKKINKLSLTCNLKNSNVKDTFNNPILSLTQDKSTARYESLTDNQYHKEKGSRTRQTSSKTKAQRTLSQKAIEDELPSSKLTLSYSENGIKSSEVLKNTSNPMADEGTLDNKLNDLKTLRDKYEQLKPAASEGNLTEISDDEDNNLVENNANIGSQIIIRKARNALIQTESSKTKSNDTVEQNLLENNLFSLKTTGHYSQLETPIKLDRSVFDSGLLTNASNNKIISQGVIENSVNVSSPSTNIESASTAQIKKTFENSFSQNVSDEDSSLPIIAVCTPKQVLRLSKLLNKKSKKLEEKVIQDIEVFKSKSTLENRCKFEFDRIDEGIYERKHEKVISRKEESERAQEVDCELKFRNCLEEIRNAKLSVCKKLSKVDENLSDNSASSLLNISATSIYSANNVDKGFNVRNDEDSQTLTKTVTVTPIKTQAPLLNPTFVNKQLIDTIHKISFCHKRDYAELEKDENFTSENTFSDSLLSESLSCYSRHDTIASKESARMENDFCCDNTSLNANLRSIFDNNSSSDLQDTRNINLVSKLTLRKNELEFHNDASSNISTIINNAVKDTEVVLNDNSTEKKNLKHSQELLQELYSQSLFSSIEENQISQTNSITNEVLANSCLSNTKICNNSLKFFEDTVLQVPNNENDINLDTQNNQQSRTIKLKTNSNVQKEILFGNNKEFVKEAVSNVNMLPDVITNARSLNTEINECVEYDFIPETPLKETITTEKIILYPIPIEDSFISKMLSKETVTSENQILTENLIEDHLISKTTFQDTSATEKNCLTQNESKKANMVENQLSVVTTDKVETDDKLCKRVSVIIDYTTQKAVTKILQIQSIQKSVHVKSTSEINKISNLKNMTEILQLKENDQSKNITNKTAVQNKNWFSNDKTVDRIATSTFKKDINDFTKLHQTITNSFTSTHSKSSSKYSSKKIKLYNPNNPVITGNTEEPLLIDAQNSQSLQISNALTKNFKRNFEYSSTFSQSSNKPAKKMNRKNFVPNETLLSSGVKKKSKSNLFLNKTNNINTGKTKKINILQNLVIHPGKRIVNCNFEKKQETLDEIISNIQNNEKFNSLIKSICTQMKISQDNGKPKQMPHCNDDKLFRKPAKRSSTWKIFDEFNNNCASKVKKNDTIKDNTFLQNSLQENDFDENLKNNYEELYKLILKCSKSGNNDETRTKVISVIDGVLANLNHTYKSLQERFSHEKDTSSSNDKLLNVLENLIATINKYLIQK
ncbi:hypothetical protein RN001_000902 [Aquatica leii]|uniref:Uncharacterized protein n=1 Tax=Aquatica leii TaxID=1421715 RepID=A0AAN7PMV3_9COLE|nr:hypothetical protein RN001_000902 [Aquatica leii]